MFRAFDPLIPLLGSWPEEDVASMATLRAVVSVYMLQRNQK